MYVGDGAECSQPLVNKLSTISISAFYLGRLLLSDLPAPRLEVSGNSGCKPGSQRNTKENETLVDGVCERQLSCETCKGVVSLRNAGWDSI